MRKTMGMLATLLVVGAGSALGQGVTKPSTDDVYCSGTMTGEAIPRDVFVISGEQSSPTTVFGQNDYVYINKGADDGVKIGDLFQVMRPMKDLTKNPWFTSQPSLAKAMGLHWVDVGKIKVVALTPKVATAQVVYTCDWFERGDIVRPFTARNAPEIRKERFDQFAPWNGRPLAMVVDAKNHARQAASRDIIYVNLGSSQGVKDGDYFRIFRYQNRPGQKVFQLKKIEDRIFGFGAPPGGQKFTWSDLPREILGEGVVMRTTENSSTVLITHTLREVFMGDYVELKEPPAPKPPPPPPPAAAVNRAPTLAVSADRNSVLAGERVRISGKGVDPDGDPLRYAWRASAGQLSGTGPTVQLDTSGLAPGRYTITGRVEDGRGGVADSSTTVTVEAPPPTPQASKLSEGFYRVDGSQPDNVLKRILDDVALRLRNDARARALIIGYADSTEANPDKLAAARAEGAKAYLAERGIAAARVDTRIAAGQSGAGRQNRRVDIIWLPEGATY